MTKYIKLFETHAAYNTYITGQDKVLPNVSYCEDNNEVHYNKWVDPVRFVAKFNVTDTIGTTSLFNNPGLLQELEIDGVAYTGSDIYSHYYHQFDTTGIHTVKYTLTNGTTSIDSSSFAGKVNIISITIPNSITTIGVSAFSGCTSLTSVTIPNTVTTIGNGAFSQCTSLTSIGSVGSEASIRIPNSVTSIGDGAFNGCTSLTSIVMDGNNTHFDSRNNCNAIIETSTNKLVVGCQNTIIPNTVTTIGNGAFQNCYYLTSITIPSSVTSIGSAFTGCYFISSNFINNTNLDAEYNYYWGATIVDSDTDGLCIQNNVLVRYRGSSKNVIIPNTITSIDQNAFSYCYNNVTSVAIPNSVTSIGQYAFFYCSGLTTITIPDSVTSIGNYAFNGCTGLTSVTIGNSVTAIGENAFGYCSNLTSVTIPNNVSTIGNSAFYGCRGLTNVVIGNSVTSIGQYAFTGCSGLTSITIPNSVTSIGNYAFNGCTGLTSVTVEATIPPSLGSFVFNSNATGRKIYVPSASVATYKAASGWSTYASDIEAIPTT